MTKEKSYIYFTFKIAIEVLLLLLFLSIINIFLGIEGLARPMGVPILYYGVFLFLFTIPFLETVNKSISKFIFPYILFIFISFFHIKDMIDSKLFFMGISMNIIYLVLFYLAFKLDTKQIEYIFKKYMMILFYIAIVSIITYLIGVLPEPTANIFSTLHINRNNYSFILMIAFSFSLFYFLYTNSYKYLYVTLILLICLFLLYSRTSYAAIFYLFIIFFLGKNKFLKSKKVKKSKTIFLVMAIVGVVIIFSFSSTIYDRVVDMANIVNIFGQKELTDHDHDGRRQLLMLAHLNNFIEHPLLGVGFNQGNLYLGNIGTHIGSAHNTIIRIFEENGFIGGGLYAYFLFKIFLLFRKNIFTPIDKIILHTFVALAILSLGNEYFLTNPYIWIFISIGVSYKLKNHNKVQYG